MFKPTNCQWCEQQFTPRPPGSDNMYRLLSAGRAICWDCSDLYDATQIKLHFDPMRCKLNSTMNLVTESGYKLPFKALKFRRQTFTRRAGTATDSFGNKWAIHQAKNGFNLKPVGVRG